MIKAPDNWAGNAVIMGQGYLTYKTDSASQVVPGCFSSGVKNLTIHGNKSKYSGTPAKDVGCGLLLAGANLIIESLKIIYIPSVGLVTLDWGTNRPLYQAADPDRGWAHIGRIRNIRIQFCGNDCWHCEAQDYYINDVEIVGAGDGFLAANDTYSFWAPDELVSDFRVWRNIDIGFMHCYGNYNGHGLVAGGDTTTFFIRIKFDSLIVESCLQGAWFKPSTYLQGGKIDAHEITQEKLITKISDTFYPAAVIIGCSNTRISNINSIEIVQSDPATTASYSGVGLQFTGKFNSVGSYKYTRSPTVSAGLRGTGLVLDGEDNRVESFIIKGCYGTDSRGTPSSCIVASSGTHYVNGVVGFGNVGIRVISGHLMGRIHSLGNLTTWQSGFDTETTIIKSLLQITSTSGSNHQVVRGGAGAVNTASTSEQAISITGLQLPYVPASSEVNPHLVIDATNGSSIYPQLDYIMYNPAGSSTTQLAFVVKLKNNNSPMQVTIGAKLN